jgi:hypothetical protein
VQWCPSRHYPRIRISHFSVTSITFWRGLISHLYWCLLHSLNPSEGELHVAWGVIYCVAQDLTWLFSVNRGVPLVSHQDWGPPDSLYLTTTWLHYKALGFTKLETCSRPFPHPHAHSKHLSHCNLERLLKWNISFTHRVNSGLYFRDKKKNVNCIPNKKFV